MIAALTLFGWSFVTGLQNPLHSAASDAPVEAVERPGTMEMAGIRVEVLNGSGEPGIARAATRKLRDWGFDVVYLGNAGHFDHETSTVIQRAGDMEGPQAVAAALGIGALERDPDSTLALEVTVILGKDWNETP